MASNTAAWLDGKDARLRVAESPLPKAGADEIVVKNFAIAVNPVDWKIQDHGLFIQKWPAVLGCDVAGEVTEVGSDVKNVKEGDRVFGHTINLIAQEPQYGGFQAYSLVKAAKSALIPGSISYAEASVLPLALDTAAVGLYSSASEGQGLGLPFPSLDPKPCGKTIVVWGGSSSVGAITIQLAAASGAKVITTASTHNADFCKKLGAAEVFDYKSASVVDDVVKAVQAAGGDFAGVYDTISLPDQSYNHTLAILEKLGGGVIAVVLPPPENPPSSVKVGNVFGINDLTHPLWADFITQALEAGKFVCAPPPLVVGKGLEAVQKGLDENKKGVSAKKVVIELS